jgi:phosphatidylcholine synthase
MATTGTRKRAPLRIAAAWSVHLFTAIGTICTLGALWAILQNDFRVVFYWLALAIAIDAADGTLARAARVKEVLPVFDGAKLDDIVDYMTFVMVPVFLMVASGVLQGPLGFAAAGSALLASAYRFCHTAAKTEDHFFTGFPSYWNIIVFYQYVFDTPAGMNAALVLILSALVFAPLRFIYPSRTVFMRPTSIFFGLVWAAGGLVVIDALPERRTTIAAVTLLYPLYYTAVSFYLQFQLTRKPSSDEAAG